MKIKLFDKFYKNKLVLKKPEEKLAKEMNCVSTNFSSYVTSTTCSSTKTEAVSCSIPLTNEDPYAAYKATFIEDDLYFETAKSKVILCQSNWTQVNILYKTNKTKKYFVVTYNRDKTPVNKNVFSCSEEYLVHKLRDYFNAEKIIKAFPNLIGEA